MSARSAEYVGTMRFGVGGELIPTRGFSRVRAIPLPRRRSAWRSHDGLLAVSGCEVAFLPGTDPAEPGPQWLVSVSRPGPARCNTTRGDLLRVVDAFAMPAFDEDNHHPGVARHLWCPIDAAYRSACECKVTEVVVTNGDYEWTTELDECRGCEYALLTGMPCPLHPLAERTSAVALDPAHIDGSDDA